MKQRSKQLLIDIGNSNTVYASYNGQTLGQKQSIKTQELNTHFSNTMLQNYEQLIIASVVPNANAIFNAHPNAHFISADNIPILNINMKNPEDIGADRLVTALAAYQRSNGPCLVIDSGTAITFCYVDANATYQGGAIVPGMKIASQALNDYTAKIPLINMATQETILGKNTKEAVEIGLYHGYIHLINGLIKQYRQLDPNITIIATGNGINGLKAQLLDDIQVVEDLIFEGLIKIAAYQT